MRVAGITLKHFAPFRDSGISELDVSFVEKVQIIIGSNGAGKSTYLKQLSPMPPTRTMFDKNGYKSLVFEKDGIYYKLDSEFEKPSSPHLFFEGDNEENLNPGRTTETQRELITEHLGITPVINELIMNTYTFPKWTPSRRKEFLMGVNPDQIGFIQGLIKQTSSKVKACRNNLARLSERKILLEQQLVDDETMEALLLEKEHISNDLGNFQQILMNIEVGMRTVGDINDVSLTTIPAIRQIVRRCHYRLSGLSHVNRNDAVRQREREQTMSAIAVTLQQLQEKDEEINTKSTELMDMETRYRELAVDGDLQMIDLTIERLETERDRYHITRPPFELSAEDLESRYQELDTLRERLLIFTNLTVPLLSTKRRQRRERILTQMQYKQSTYNQRLGDLQGQYDDLSKRHSVKPSDIPDSPCAKDACPLYAHFMGEYQHTEEKRNNVKRSIEKGERKIKRLNLLVEGLGNYLEQSKPFVDQIRWLVDYAQSNPVLHHILRQIDILSTLSSSPNKISRQLQDAYDRIDQWLKLKTILSDLETARALKSLQISSEDHDTVKLVSAIETMKKTLYGLRGDIDSLSERRAELDKQLTDINTFNEIKETIFGIRDQHQVMMESLANGYEKDRLIILRKGVEEIRAQHFLRMSNIETTLRAQSGVRERYEEEVITQILVIDKELADLQQIESALIIGIKENQVDFINDIFKQANRLIEMIWTLPLKIEEVTLDDPLNYEFQVTGDNQSTRELSDCSEGQTEILTLTINLALRIVLGHFDFPLMLDETGRTLDEKHRNNLILLLKRLMDDKLISQLFLISHNPMIHEAFTNSETFVIREDNIVLPSVYNQHVSMK